MEFRPLLQYIPSDALLGGVRKCVRINFLGCAEIKLITSYTIAGIPFSSSRLSPDVGKREARYLSSLQSVFALNNTPRMLSIYVSRFIYNASRHGMPQNLKLLLNVPLELTFFQYVLIGIQYLPSSQPLQSITPLQSLVNTVI